MYKDKESPIKYLDLDIERSFKPEREIIVWTSMLVALEHCVLGGMKYMYVGVRERAKDKVCALESCGGLTVAKHFTVKHALRTGHVLCIDSYNSNRRIPHGKMVFLPSTLKTTRVFRPG